MMQLQLESTEPPALTGNLDVARGALLALDLGTTTGWAFRAPDGLITSGTVSFRPAATTVAACATCASPTG